MNTKHPDTPDTPPILEVFRSKSELDKILWITGIWVFFSISQSVYDYLVLLSQNVNLAGYDFWTSMMVNAIATFVAGMIGGAILVAYLQRWVRNHPYGQALVYILIAFTLIIFFVTVLAFLTRVSLAAEEGLPEKDIFSQLGHHIRSLTFAKDYFLWLFIVLLTIAGILINDKYGPGNLSSFFMGRYFRPKREEHIFMFLDLRASTYIAQVLGEQQYFNFIKDVVRDVTPVILRHKGNIYQYVGDEVTVSWWMKSGLNKLNCIRCPIEVRKVFNHRSSYYMAQYGVVPDFKAGLHCGPVMVGEIGVVKRDIAFSGEVVGTAARIQNRCNHLEVNLLISHDLKELLPWEGSKLKPEHKGDLLIKGKMENLPLYTVVSE
ncbi:MAG: adenylate/guanylate cyclase domain-containing protein [Saprospiraceae bacterium]|uniref:Adenylate/guanylate cyclase domain-containing protein n=1 Tax=Candidatus Opimibacter skivensis TaxID=2982028 RepID=A0A9D7SWU1_9BACT|nr:adenylate/guanylate cyclase domain-containing protein [Candidatus Opimibacter skivensis]